MENPNEQPRLTVNRKKPVMTYAILAVTVLVFVLELALGATEDTYILAMMGAKVNAWIRAGQYWRLVTPMLLHANLSHIAMNMISLYLWGPNVEALYGRGKMLLIYLISGIVGCIGSYFFSSALSVGASGAIFGLFGTLLSFGRDDKTVFRRFFGRNLFILIAVNVINGFLNSGIDNFAHLGGLAGGWLAAEALGTYKRPHAPLRAVSAWLGICALIAAVVVFPPFFG